MFNHMFEHDDVLFGIKTVEGVMVSYQNERKATTAYTILVHDCHAAVSDAVEREGVWVPLVTMHWKEVRDEMNLEASKPKDMDIEDVQKYIEGGAYDKLISVSTV